MTVPQAMVDALPDKDRQELELWATMAGVSTREYLAQCIRKGHELLGGRIVDTPASRRDRYFASVAEDEDYLAKRAG